MVKFGTDDTEISNSYRLKIAFPQFIPVLFLNGARVKFVFGKQVVDIIAIQCELIKISDQLVISLLESFRAQFGKLADQDLLFVLTGTDVELNAVHRQK